MKNSGLKESDDKTDACLFFKKDCMPVRITVENDTISTNKGLNVLGVIFDSKLHCSGHMAKAISKIKLCLECSKIFQYEVTNHTGDKQLLLYSSTQL
jgi:hypothetical protein